ncbi:MAG: DNRLRE domain-containing protein [Opitutaceae bacterium]|jgi:hypothetical protein|nr:DNRLRE domain-containing protein [Opitutaceae bacterium]
MKLLAYSFSFSAALFLGLAAPVRGGVSQQVVSASADTFGRSDQDGAGSTPNGTSKTIIAGELVTNKDLHIYFEFTLPALPDGAVIESVSLNLSLASGNDGSATGSVFSLYALTESFDEATANWASRSYSSTSPSDTIAWTTPGGTVTTPALATTTITSNTIQTWSSAGLVDQVKSAYTSDSGSGSVVRLMLAAPDANNSTRKIATFDSREATNAPQLVITYSLSSVPEPATCALLAGAAILGLAAVRRLRCRVV